MSIMEMEHKAREIKELKRMAEELDAEITALEDALKAAMGDQEQVIAGRVQDHVEARHVSPCGHHSAEEGATGRG